MRIDARRRKTAQRSLAMAALAALLWGCSEPSPPGSPNPASGAPGAPGEFKRCCFEVQIDTAGEFSSHYGGRDYAHLGGPHKLAWRWTARELVYYYERTYSNGRLDQQLIRSKVARDNAELVLVRRAEANVVYEASSDLVEYPPGYSGSTPPNPLGACTARLMTNGFRHVLDRSVDRHVTDHAGLDDRFLDFREHDDWGGYKQHLLQARLSPRNLGEDPGDCDTASIFSNNHFTGPGPLRHEMQGPWKFYLAQPTSEQFRTGTRFEAHGRNSFKEEIEDPQGAHGQAAYPHKAEGFYEIKVTFTFVPPAQAGQSAGEWAHVPPLRGGAPGADLALTVRTAVGSVPVGVELIYTLAVTNKGPGTAVGTVLTDNLPAGVRFISATPSRGSCSGTSTVVCNLANLEKGGSATVVIAIAPTAASTLINSAKVMSSVPDINPADNSATNTTRAD